MNLRDQLREILPEILSENPADSIKGTELIRLVKYRLNQDYSDATLRYHFSIMSCDPSAPIAKVEQGQGYYLRTSTIHSFHSARNLISNSQGIFGEGFPHNAQEVDLALVRAEKFRSVFTRHSELNHRFPFAFEESFSDQNRRTNLWRFPDTVLLDWHVAEASENGLQINPSAIDLCRNSGSPPFSLSGVKLRLELTHSSFREDFFQALSNSLWAHAGELVVAARLNDEKLLDDLRALGSRFNLGITSYGLDLETLDQLPEAAVIKSLDSREFEAIEARFAVNRITAATRRPALTWPQITELRNENREFDELFRWIDTCLADHKPRPFHPLAPRSATSVRSERPEHEKVALRAT